MSVPRSLCALLLIAASAVFAIPHRAAATDGASLASVCASCHRLDGRNTGMPSVIRWEAEEIVEKMHAFRSDERANNVMRAVSLSLSDEEITTVADYLAALGRKAKTP